MQVLIGIEIRHGDQSAFGGRRAAGSEQAAAALIFRAPFRAERRSHRRAVVVDGHGFPGKALGRGAGVQKLGRGAETVTDIRFLGKINPADAGLLAGAGRRIDKTIRRK